MYVYSIQGEGGLVACSPRKFLEIRFSSYVARGVLYPLFGCPCMDVLSHLTSNFTRQGAKVGRTAGGVASLEIQLVNSQAPEIAMNHLVSSPDPPSTLKRKGGSGEYSTTFL